MKKRNEIQRLRERVASVEAQVAGLEENLRSSQARSLQTEKMVDRIYERSGAMQHIAWEVLRTTRPEALQRIQDADRDPAG